MADLDRHIHQVMQKTKGSVVFRTAMQTAFLQQAPGTVNSSGPKKVDDDILKTVLGITEVKVSSKAAQPGRRRRNPGLTGARNSTDFAPDICPPQGRSVSSLLSLASQLAP